MWVTSTRFFRQRSILRRRLYKVEWYSGSSLFSEGDYVILTTDDGSAVSVFPTPVRGQMIRPDNDEVDEVCVEEIDD